MKLIKALKWFFLALGIVCLGAMIGLVFFIGDTNQLFAVWKFTEKFMVNALALAAPAFLCLGTFMAFLQIWKRQYGGKKLPFVLSLVFLGAVGFSLLVFGTDWLGESLETMKSPDGKHSLYYIDGEDGETESRSVYRKSGVFEYERIFYSDDNFSDFEWSEDGVEHDGKNFEC
ncbi:MAG: hypothetical protein K5898_00630 [Ruminococcus sp.]|uniref:hypothetical protein n=1 Tax=Ruminococcus sp. TaxID=41978 RepID=UPI0025EFCE38|nr:hypothetical protein [Ruminococcus sp.]MCR4793690.1 hypothetical protein [Ruminococcus sp.]